MTVPSSARTTKQLKRPNTSHQSYIYSCIANNHIKTTQRRRHGRSRESRTTAPAGQTTPAAAAAAGAAGGTRRGITAAAGARDAGRDVATAAETQTAGSDRSDRGQARVRRWHGSESDRSTGQSVGQARRHRLKLGHADTQTDGGTGLAGSGAEGTKCLRV